MAILGTMIQTKRKELGLSQEKLAEKIGKTVGYVGQIERGISYPSYSTLLQLVEVLEIDAQTLISTNDINIDEKFKYECTQIFSWIQKYNKHARHGLLGMLKSADTTTESKSNSG